MHFPSPQSPDGHSFFIPVEIVEDDDVTTLETIQMKLASFGFQRPICEIATFVQRSPAFTSNLQSNLYPLALPKTWTTIYQSYRYAHSSSSSSFLMCTLKVHRRFKECRLVQVPKIRYHRIIDQLHLIRRRLRPNGTRWNQGATTRVPQPSKSGSTLRYVGCG